MLETDRAHRRAGARHDLRHFVHSFELGGDALGKTDTLAVGNAANTTLDNMNLLLDFSSDVFTRSAGGLRHLV